LDVVPAEGFPMQLAPPHDVQMALLALGSPPPSAKDRSWSSTTTAAPAARAHKRNDDWLAKYEYRVQFHISPTSASWLNQIEIVFG